MSYLDQLKKNTTIENTKGGRYYASTYDANLDIFVGISRYNDTDEIIQKYKKAIDENKSLALANLLYILDIREGKGERLLFKTIFRYLCQNEKEMALLILPEISNLGRWDYILEGLDTLIDEDVISLIKLQVNQDKVSDNPSLLAKWLPTHKTHGIKNETAQNLIKKLGITEENYRKTLSSLRKKIDIVENKLSSKQYNTIDFEKVPTKAMLKYKNSFARNCADNYQTYLEQVKNGEKKINTTGLYCYEIIRNILLQLPVDQNLYDVMWNNQKDILNGYDKNILVVADTSGSMTNYDNLPLANSIGLAIYMAERNTGIFKNHFITFSNEPAMQEIVGNNIVDKVNNIRSIIGRTDIDKVFKLLLDTATQNNTTIDDMPETIFIISDMEFDKGTYSENGTNFDGWKKAFNENGYNLPKLVFWNVAGNTSGVPVTKFDKDVVMISGFSTNLLDNILCLEDYNPVNLMLQTLENYLSMLDKRVVA